jgi:hypothetical protein
MVLRQRHTFIFTLNVISQSKGNKMSDEQKMQTATRRIVKKITAKIVCGKVDIEKLIDYGKANGKSAVMPLFAIIGLASDSQAGETALGPYVKLLGQFKAVNADTGEEFRSGAAILPGSANDLVYGALKGLGEGGGSVEFALRVGVQRDETAAIGYVYVVEQVYQQGANDALAALEARLAPPANVAQIRDASKTVAGKKK